MPSTFFFALVSLSLYNKSVWWFKMYIQVGEDLKEVIITRKKTTRNTYMRVKEDGKVYVSTNILVSDKKVLSILQEHQKDLLRMSNIQEKKKAYQEKFFYLGKEYDIIYTNYKEISLGENKVFVGRDMDIAKWYRKQAETLFKERLDYYYNLFTYNIPYPRLRLRTMKSRWGVCNVREKIVTLNIELMKKKPECLDYVVVHELSHLIEANHSSRFWKVVEENYPNYKKVRKELKDYE